MMAAAMEMLLLLPPLPLAEITNAITMRLMREYVRERQRGSEL